MKFLGSTNYPKGDSAMKKIITFTLQNNVYASAAPIEADGFSVTADIRKYPEYSATYEQHRIVNTTGEDIHVEKFIDYDIHLPLDGKVKDRYETTGGTALRVVRMEGMEPSHPYSRDDLRSATEYALTDDFLRKNRSYENLGGRSSDGIMPLFDVTNGKDGYIIFIGWTGSWHADFDIADGGVHGVLCLGNNTFRLPAGESLATMSMLIMEYHDGQKAARNRFRRLMKKHFSTVGQPGRPTEAMSCWELWGALPSDEMCRRIDALKENNILFDYIWLDAGWYGDFTEICRGPFDLAWSKFTGYWKINETWHPDGLLDVVKHTQDAGMQFELWFEPERCVVKLPPIKEHPEWFTVIEGNGVIDYGNPDAWQYVYDTLCHLIDTLKLGCYRQDFNTDIINFWRKDRTPEEASLKELQHINGLYRLWDALLERYPHLLIDNCASGGRRFDLETVKRAIPFFRSDYQCNFNADPDVTQCHNTISEYLPYNGCTTKIKADTYAARSTFSSAWGLACWNSSIQTMDESDFAWASKMSREYCRIRPYFSCDYYSLASAGYDKSSWVVWQYDRPEENDGVVLAFRRARSPIKTMTMTFGGEHSGKSCTFTDMDTNERFTVSTEELAKGFTLTIDEPYKSRILLYHFDA